MEWETPRVALVTFTDMREEGISSEAVEQHLRDKQNELAAFLGANGVAAVDPLRELRTDSSPNYGVRSFSEIDLLMGILSKSHIDAAIIGSWMWSPPMLVKEFLRKLNRPSMYYAENDPMGGSLSQMSATCARLMEWSVNRFALTHERNFGNRKDLLSWVRGVHAAAAMRESAALLWGGTYAVRMEQLQDDIPKLKSFMIRDILMEDQYVLISRAEKIIQTQKESIAAFYGWLTGNGLVMHRDKKMVTDQALVSVGDDHIEFANCGAGSVFWAANSRKAKDVFPRVEAMANIHGQSGAAFSYFGVEAPQITVGRLTRINGRYYMQLGTGQELDARKFLQKTLGDKGKSHLAGTRGKVIVNLGVKGENFVKVIGANHLSATLGDVTAEVEATCRLWGVPVVRLDSDEEMKRFYHEVRETSP